MYVHCVHSTGYSSNEFIFNASKFTLQYPYPSVKYNIYVSLLIYIFYHGITYMYYFPPFKLVN